MKLYKLHDASFEEANSQVDSLCIAFPEMICECINA